MQTPHFKAIVMGFGLLLVWGAVHPAHAFLGWRDTVASVWTDKPVAIDGHATEWSEWPMLDVEGLSFRAMNDRSSVYLLIRSTTNEGRLLLAGKYRQNFTLWFLKPDHTTKAWGLDLDFGHAISSNAWVNPEQSPTLIDFGVTPLVVTPEGLEVSTATLPVDIELQADLSSQIGRQPVYEIRIPLQRIEHHGRSIYMDFISSEVSPDVKAEIQPPKPVQAGGGKTSAPAGGGHHHHGMGGGQGTGPSAQTVDVPEPLTLHLTLHLASKP